jgi:monothiol glutaredoxin
MNIIDEIKQQIAENPVILYMKGSPKLPQCGFSSKAAKIIAAAYQAEFAYVDILQNPEIRAHLPDVSGWPTFPQLFIDGELIGGSDIISTLFEQGELKKTLDAVVAK